MSDAMKKPTPDGLEFALKILKNQDRAGYRKGLRAALEAVEGLVPEAGKLASEISELFPEGLHAGLVRAARAIERLLEEAKGDDDE